MTFPNQISTDQENAAAVVNEELGSLAAFACYAKKSSTTTGLTWGYYGGRSLDNFAISDGTLSLTASSTNYVVVAKATGAITVSTSSTNWNDTDNYARVYKITTGASTVSGTPEDHRATSYGIFAGGGGAVTSGDISDFTEASQDVVGAMVAAAGGSYNDGAGTITLPTGGDASTNTSSSVDSEVALFSGTAGKTLKRATGSGFAKLTSGVLSVVSPASADISDFAEAVDDRVGALLVAGSNVTLTYNDGAGTLTIAATGASGTAGKHAIYVAAGSMSPSVTGGCAALAGVASAANQPDIRTLDFDTTTEEYAQFGVVMPKSWNEGTVTFAAHWSHASTTTNFGVAWKVQAVAISDDDNIAASFGTAVAVTDTGGTTNDLYTTSESSAITVAGSPAAGDMVFFRVYREPSNGSDTMAIDARLHGITLYITTDAENDA